MIERILYYIREENNPYENLAIEEYLLRTVNPGECILYIWQNRNTVVIGKNQNAFAEVRVSLLESNGGYLVRRLSGGGAVYHDLGNLNFTFLVKDGDYNVDKQSEVILKMIESFGIKGEKTGRNDILAEGRKFSGNAYYKSGDSCYHHGTIMIDVDKAPLEKYLNVPVDKLKSKGVESVKSRVVNLRELSEEIDVPRVQKALVEAFEKVYGLEACPMDLEAFDWDRIEEAKERFQSPEWKYGKKPSFSFSVSRRFDWGGIELCPLIKDGIIEECEIYSDAMEGDFIALIKESLKGVEYNMTSLKDALERIKAGDPEEGVSENTKDMILQGIEELFGQLF